MALSVFLDMLNYYWLQILLELRQSKNIGVKSTVISWGSVATSIVVLLPC